MREKRRKEGLSKLGCRLRSLVVERVRRISTILSAGEQCAREFGANGALFPGDQSGGRDELSAQTSATGNAADWTIQLKVGLGIGLKLKTQGSIRASWVGQGGGGGAEGGLELGSTPAPLDE